MIVIIIEKDGWQLRERGANPGMPDRTLYTGRWFCGPIEIARIIRRVGLNVTVLVEP